MAASSYTAEFLWYERQNKVLVFLLKVEIGTAKKNSTSTYMYKYTYVVLQIYLALARLDKEELGTRSKQAGT